MEIWDGYYEDGTLSGTDLIRGEQIPEGLHHLVCEILVRHTDGDFLLMKRDLKKPSHPGEYEASAGGSALKGESAIHCAQRELKEETGICGYNFQQVGYSVTKDTIYYIYACQTDCAKQAVTLQEGETIDFQWIPEEKFIAFIHSEYAIKTQISRFSPYFKQQGWM